jgi:NAD(P)-dependent dehydrogenase (short-subunit alcohol dehydrogenase family)
MKNIGSVVVVTGASSGIGRALAQRFAEAGAKVVLAARSSEKLGALSKELRARGLEALAIPTDVTDRTQVDQLIGSVFNRYQRLDILVNNAGRGAAAHVADTPPAHYRALFDLNVLGPVNMMQAAIPHMRAQGGGLIVNVSSGASRRPLPGLAAYGASKAALDLISNTAREELARDNIRIMTVYPPNTESEAARNMLGDPQIAVGLLLEAITKAIKPDRMVPVPAETVASMIVEATRQTRPTPDLFLDAGMYVE